MSALSNVLLINRDDINLWTSIDGNVDSTKMPPHVMTATEIHLQPVLGTKLLDKCRQIIVDGTLNATANSAYKTLIEEYITPVLVYYTMWDMLPFLQFSIRNGGIHVHQSETATSATEEQMNMIIQKFKDKGEFFTRRLNAFLCENSAAYTEYHTNTGDDLHPVTEPSYHGLTFGT